MLSDRLRRQQKYATNHSLASSPLPIGLAFSKKKLGLAGAVVLEIPPGPDHRVVETISSVIFCELSDFAIIPVDDIMREPCRGSSFGHRS
jgi:hypothetical protein